MVAFEPGKFYWNPENPLEVYFFQDKGLESNLRGIVNPSEKDFPVLEEITPLSYLTDVNSRVARVAAFVDNRFFNRRDYTRASRSSP